jgi:hypothetical protein
MPGTQAQNVTFVADEDLQDPPASTVVPLLGLAAALDEPAGALAPVVLPPQAASVATATVPANPAATRPVRRPGPRRRGRLDREVDFIQTTPRVLS